MNVRMQQCKDMHILETYTKGGMDRVHDMLFTVNVKVR